MKDKHSIEVNLDDDLSTILKAKIKRHEEQIKFHQSQHKELIELLKSKRNGHSTTASTENGEESQYEKPWYWESVLPKLISTAFANKEFRNPDVISEVNVPNMEDDDYKRKVRYAVSMALAAFVEREILTSRKKSGIRGYLYKKK